MANIITVAGLATIKVDTGAANALETLGFTKDGAHIRVIPYMYDVPTDENGGDAGPPTDIQAMGAIAQITLHFTKYDESIMDKVVCIQYGGTAGTIATPGSLMFGDTKSYRLLIHSVSFPRNFLRVVFREPFEVNKGTKYSEHILIGTAYKNASNILWNTTTS